MIAWIYNKLAKLFQPKIVFTPEFDLSDDEDETPRSS